MSETTTGFRIVLRDGSHTLRISNTEKTGYVTFKDSSSLIPDGIDLSEEKFIELVKYLGLESDRIKRRIKAKKPEADFKVENPEEKKPRKTKKEKKISEKSDEIISVPKEEAKLS